MYDLSILQPHTNCNQNKKSCPTTSNNYLINRLSNDLTKNSEILNGQIVSGVQSVFDGASKILNYMNLAKSCFCSISADQKALLQKLQAAYNQMFVYFNFIITQIPVLNDVFTNAFKHLRCSCLNAETLKALVCNKYATND